MASKAATVLELSEAFWRGWRAHMARAQRSTLTDAEELEGYEARQSLIPRKWAEQELMAAE